MKEIAECKNHNPVTSIYGVTSLLFAIKSLSEHISESIEWNLMKLDILIDGHQRKCRVQAKVTEHPSVWPSVHLELSPLLLLWMHTLFFS